MLLLQLITTIQNDGLKKWKFKVKSNSNEIVKKLNTAFESFGGFVFNIEDNKNDSVAFKFHKPVKYPDQILHRNRLVVNGKTSKTDIENETDVEIDFHQHFFMKLTVLSVISVGIILMILLSKLSSGTLMFILGGITIVAGLVLMLALKKKLENDIRKYKILISQILEF